MSKLHSRPSSIVRWLRRPISRRTFPSGTAATEFALILPILLLLAAGCLDIGRAIRVYTVMSNAASAGAEYGATHGFYEPYTRSSWEQRVRDAVRDELACLVPRAAVDAQFAVRVLTGPDSVDGALPRITIEIDHNFATSFGWSGLAGRIPLQCRNCIRRYR